MSVQPYELTLTQAAAEIAAGTLSPVELTASVLDRIAAVEPTLSAFVTVTADAAREAAKAAEHEIAHGRRRGPLHGVPVGVKDLIDTADAPTTASSQVRAGHVAAADATVVRRLRDAGAVLVGKTHTHEFAYGVTTPQTRNPWDTRRTPGGSSGGSAAAVAAGASTFALGTDTGGSIRIPAALSGVVGLKPTYGLVPRHGVTALSWSLDTVGPITRTAADAALVLDAIAGPDAADPVTTGLRPAPTAPPDGRPARIGVPTDHYVEQVAPDVLAAVRAAADVLAGLGAELVDVTVPMADLVHATHWAIMVPEAAAYHGDALRAVPDSFGPDVRVLLEAGELFLASDYLRAQRVRTRLREEWSALLTTVDAVLTPTVPSTAVPAGQVEIDWPGGVRESVTDAYVRLTAPANLTGLPAVSLPAGLDRDGLPIGVQLVGRAFEDAALLRLGSTYETATGRSGVLAPL